MQNDNTLTAFRPILTAKGAAKPSPAQLPSDPAQMMDAGNTALKMETDRGPQDIAPMGGLAGLIKRKAPVIAAAAAPDAMRPAKPKWAVVSKSREVSKSDDTAQVSERVTSFFTPRTSRRQQPTAVRFVASGQNHLRRKLTVRLSMDKFQQLDAMAKSQGRSYQDIQSCAISEYLERISKN